jgi:ubiquinone/menaquinone biosynthesis C-methylase UbiE
MNCGKIAWNFYLLKFNEIVNSIDARKILKTDCNNEAYSKPRHGGLVKNLSNFKDKEVFLVEYDQKTINDALKKFPDLNILLGDIRKLTFSDLEFDLVADFSTLDHVSEKDAENALREYYRVLKQNGHLILVCWFSYEEKNVKKNFSDWNSKKQYYFWEPEILNICTNLNFRLISKETITRIPFNRWIHVEREKASYYLEFFHFIKD